MALWTYRAPFYYLFDSDIVQLAAISPELAI